MSDSPNVSAAGADSASVDPALLQTALAAQKDDYFRLAADFDNFRKRTRRDSAQQAAAEKEAFIHDLLPILDNLDRALACEGATSSAQLHQGVEMTLKQVEGLLHRHGIESVKALGQPFDPHRHEAVAVGHDPRQPDHVVLEVVQRGYSRGDKMIRPAKVIVNDLARSPGAGRGR
ncbi:MAG: nucleotide exchange factor GrpE [Chthoniobacter sp.]|uniref:nucleotide exchange factor GrpE n=1 Tax=Chthoniobacter sp. TaxID=2510640 RepID=UPI0032A45849